MSPAQLLGVFTCQLFTEVPSVKSRQNKFLKKSTPTNRNRKNSATIMFCECYGSNFLIILPPRTQYLPVVAGISQTGDERTAREARMSASLSINGPICMTKCHCVAQIGGISFKIGGIPHI